MPGELILLRADRTEQGAHGQIKTRHDLAPPPASLPEASCQTQPPAAPGPLFVPLFLRPGAPQGSDLGESRHRAPELKGDPSGAHRRSLYVLVLLPVLPGAPSSCRAQVAPGPPFPVLFPGPLSRSSLFRSGSPLRSDRSESYAYLPVFHQCSFKPLPGALKAVASPLLRGDGRGLGLFSLLPFYSSSLALDGLSYSCPPHAPDGLVRLLEEGRGV